MKQESSNTAGFIGSLTSSSYQFEQSHLAVITQLKKIRLMCSTLELLSSGLVPLRAENSWTLVLTWDNCAVRRIRHQLLRKTVFVFL